MRTPTLKNKEDSRRWLSYALVNLENNEYHRVRQLCQQVIRALQRKEKK